jgi:hypothetical protein
MIRMGMMIAVAAMCFGISAPAQAGGGGGKSGSSKGNITANVKNVGSQAMGASVQSGTPSFPTDPAAYKQLAGNGGTGSFTVKSGTFTLYGVDANPPTKTLQKSFSSTETAYIHADIGTGLATQVSASQF